NILTINKSHINGFIFDASNNPDLIPPLVVLALYAESESYIYGIDRLIKKECDRKTAIIEEFQKLGAKIICEENKNRFVVFPSILKSNYVSSHQDHRMAMALAIAAVNIKDGIEIDNIKCVNKSYPNFFDIFKQ
ncbi:MAG: 3-phosphoshikimate 1-carboxyvinyltransferase, partial [Bacteroidetes bacterium]|nr:3-phosphoshikimate 1-carboxyvinyltransferase [Bacteroidota bacterium]